MLRRVALFPALLLLRRLRHMLCGVLLPVYHLRPEQDPSRASRAERLPASRGWRLVRQRLHASRYVYLTRASPAARSPRVLLQVGIEASWRSGSSRASSPRPRPVRIYLTVAHVNRPVLGVITACLGFGWVLQIGERSSIRRRYNIDGGGCGDCCISFCCNVSCLLDCARTDRKLTYVFLLLSRAVSLRSRARSSSRKRAWSRTVTRRPAER